MVGCEHFRTLAMFFSRYRSAVCSTKHTTAQDSMQALSCPSPAWGWFDFSPGPTSDNLCPDDVAGQVAKRVANIRVRVVFQRLLFHITVFSCGKLIPVLQRTDQASTPGINQQPRFAPNLTSEHRLGRPYAQINLV